MPGQPEQQMQPELLRAPNLLAHFDARPLYLDPGHVKQLARLQAAEIGTEMREIVAIIHVRGVLGKFAYSRITAELFAALEDDQVRGILFAIDSPGGLAAGLSDLADLIFAAREQKPVHAFIEDIGTSAAYGLASAASHLALGKDAITGSVGTIMVHEEWSRLFEDIGITLTIFRQGRRKAEGNFLETLSKEAAAQFEAIVEEFYEEFVNLVARNRGLSVVDIKATESRVLRAREAVEMGFADAVMSPAEAAATLVARLL